MPTPEKESQVAEIRERLSRARAVVLTDYRGLNVGEISDLRGRLRKAGAEYRVVKNTLVEIAAESLGLPSLEQYLAGPTAAAFSYDDPTAPARVIQEFIRQTRKLEVKGGLVEGRVLDARGVAALADLPTRPELVARVVGGVQAPLRGVVGVLSATLRSLVYALSAVREKREGEAA